MKKLIVILSVFVIAMTTKVSAQAQLPGQTTADFDIALPTLPLGNNIVDLKEGRGTLTFFKKGDSFSNVIYKDAAGHSTKLEPTPGGTNGAPRLECKSKLPDACFSSPDKNIGLCICRPDNISNGGNTPTARATGHISFRITRTAGSQN